MAYETGTATDYQDLLLKLETFLTTNPELVRQGQQWQSLKDNTVNPYTTNKALDSDGYSLVRFFMGGGLDGQDKIIVPTVCRGNAAQGYHNIAVFTARAYSNSKGFTEQMSDTAAGVPHGVGVLTCWTSDIPYWFFANGRRFIVVAKVGHRYTSMYAGFFMPSGTDVEYPYPYAVGGTSGDTLTPYSSEDINQVRSFFNPQSLSSKNSSSLMAINPQGSLVQFDNYSGNDANSIYAKGNTLPYGLSLNTYKTMDNQYLLLPIELVEFGNQRQSLGWFDGCYHVSGHENSAESVITVGSDEYICFPALIQNDNNNWVAIRKA